MSQQEFDHIAELQKKLYTRDPDNMPKRKFGILHPVKDQTKSTWGETKLPESKLKVHQSAAGYKRFFVIALLFFFGALAVALFAYYRGAVTLSSKNVEVTILGNSFVAGGEELPVQIEIANKNSADLVDAELTINYPKGATDETGSDIVRLERELGSIGSGKTKSEEFIVVLYGEQGISRDITATLTYQLKGSSAVFTKDATFSVMVSSSPVGLTVDAPTGVVPNQPFTLTLRNNFSGDKMLPNVVARVEYPNGFVFGSATPKPTSGNNVWSLGDMQTGDERAIAITGRLVGEVSDEKAFRIYVGTPENEMSGKIAVAYNSALATLKLIQPFIAGAIMIDDKDDDVVALSIGSDIEGEVTWINNASTSVVRPTFTLTLGGDGIDLDTIEARDSYFDPLERTITWNGDTSSSLGSIAPGERGTFPFSFKTVNGAAGTHDVTLALSVKGTLPDQGGAEQSIDTIDQKVVRFASSLQFAAQSLYSIGPIKNTGPYPPKANADTTYTITWTILPSQNAITNAVATAVLPQGVSWTGTIVPTGEAISFSPDTSTVTWNIGALPKATSVQRSKTVAFQVKVKPTKTQAGTPLTLLGETKVTATDTVTNTPISLTRSQLTTRFDTDPIYAQGRDRVLP